MLQIYNTLSGNKQKFTPVENNNVSIYVCGVTVYDHCHIGHARTFIAFDVIVKYLRYLGYNVKFVRNITDVDDKIILRAQELDIAIDEFTEKYISSMHEDFARLNLTIPDEEPRATNFMPHMIAIIEKLLSTGYAYIGDNGDVYYRVSSYKDYGRLSKRNLDNMLSGVRVDVDVNKESPLDFVLWKSAKPHEPYWDSPWGKGRPGWHIECSAMSLELLGDTFDIHGGGHDLVFPHHENECAQSIACTDGDFAKYWMHTGFLQINQEKMSKSLGNFLTIKDILINNHPEVIRYFMISGHYRSFLEYSDEQLVMCRNSLDRFYAAIRGIKPEKPEPNSMVKTRFISAMNDDFNTPEAIAVLFDLVKDINKQKSAQQVGLLIELANTLGFLYQDPEEYFKTDSRNEAELEQIESLIQARTTARQNKDWVKSDQIREQLDSMGIVVEDTAKGSIWRKK